MITDFPTALRTPRRVIGNQKAELEIRNWKIETGNWKLETGN
jgi:hypothetical protein